MSETRAVSTRAAPEAIGPYSQGVWAEDLFFSAGQIGLDPDSGALVPGGIVPETHQVLNNLAAVLEAAGLTFSEVVKTTVYLAEMDEFGAMNEVYGEAFTEPYPARSTVQVRRLPREARLEIEVVARRP
ncbi:MAG: RidA family protein [Gemmatimonadota bacterium]